jgi:hypothetical protein
MVFAADDLGAWLVALLADAGRRRLTTLVLGSDQERSLRQAAAAAVQLTAQELFPADRQQAEDAEMVVSQVFSLSLPSLSLHGQRTLLEELEAEIAGRLSVLDDADTTGVGQSSAELSGIPTAVLAQKLTNHIIRQIILRGARGGSLAPLADQLNHDLTHMQGQRLEQMVGQLADEFRQALAQLSSSRAVADSIALAQLTPNTAGLARLDAGQSSGLGFAASRPVRLPPRPEHLAGRQQLLLELDIRLNIEDRSRPSVVVLHGLGGAGKTVLAVEFAFRHLEECQVVWQLPAENPQVLSSAFAELARQVVPADQLGQRDPVSSVHAVMASGSDEWVLILENAPDFATVAGVLPPAGHVRVVITSRNPLWPGRTLEVPVLARQSATEFLIARTGDPDERAAAELADELGCLPLALEQAAAYLEARGGTIAAYVALFRERRADLLARGDPAGYDQRVATTWLVSFERLQEDCPSAISLLRLLSCYAPEEIPVKLLLRQPERVDDESGPVPASLQPLLADPIAADDAIAALRRYSLVSRPEREAMSVHRLVQAVTIDRLAEEASEWRQAAGELIAGILPEDPFMTANFPVFAQLLPHALVALDPETYVIERFALFLAASGSHGSALDLEKQHLIACERTQDANSPLVLSARGNVALMTGLMGDPASAAKKYKSLLPALKRVLGPDDARVLITRANIAHIDGMTGSAAEARDAYRSLLPDIERALGADSRAALSARAHLARLTAEAGDPASARDQYAALLEVQERVLGPEHLNTLTTRANLARWTGEAGDDLSARHQLNDLVPDLERLLGPEHRETLINRANLAFVTGVRNPGRARSQYAALVPIEEQVLGPDDPQTLIARSNLARLTGEAGDPLAAKAMYVSLLKDFERIYGVYAPETRRIRLALADWSQRSPIS